MQPDQPLASDVVRRRLDALFAQLQELPATPPASEMASVGPAPAGDDDDDWVGRLRSNGAGDAPDPDTGGPSPQRRAAGALAATAHQVLTFSRRHLVTVLIIAAVGVAWTTYSILHTRSTAVADTAPRIEATPVASGTPVVAASKQIVVHVIGAVRSPGVVRLPEGSRVSDAISAAGGLGRGAALGELNLAQPLVDGTQVKIGTTSHPGGWIRDGTAGGAPGAGTGGGAATGGSAAKISLNSATVQQLDTLPGVGPVTAKKIVDWRTAHGRFSALTELQEVDGIGPKTYADIVGLLKL